MCQVCHTGSTKKVMRSSNSGTNWHIDILTYQCKYVYCRGGHCGAYGGSRCTVAFLSNGLSRLEVI